MEGGGEKEEEQGQKQGKGNGNGKSNNGSGILKTEEAERSVWLMKCPLLVAKSWRSHSFSHPHPIAKLVVSVDPLTPHDSSSTQYTLEMGGGVEEMGNAPKSFSLNVFSDLVPLCVFSETTQGDMAMEGKVGNKFDMTPHRKNMAEYGRMCRERTNRSMIKNRQIQVIDNDRGVHMRPMPGMVGFISSNSKDKKKGGGGVVKASEMKRTRRDRSELEHIMFKLFESQPNWALKQLVQETDQPAQFLKEILNDLCLYNKRGANQGTYELKPEYMKSTEDK